SPGTDFWKIGRRTHRKTPLMKSIFDKVSHRCSKIVTHQYSTSFSIAIKLLSTSIRQDIYNIYGFVRFADEIVDSFHDYDKAVLFTEFEENLDRAIARRISLNPILNGFQETVHKYSIPESEYKSFLKSMAQDLTVKKYAGQSDLDHYVYGSAEVVGLMCLRVFVKGDEARFRQLQSYAAKLGSAFQKVNFLRDLKEDYELRNRSYFPDIDFRNLDEQAKIKIIADIETDFEEGLAGISKLPSEARWGVYTAYLYYRKLVEKLKRTPLLQIRHER